MRPILFIIAGVIVSSVSLGAVIVTPLSFPELVDQSQVVVYGRVSDVRGQWTDDRHHIESFVTVRAIDYFKGHRGETVTFKVPGGRAGGLVNVWPGVPEFRDGDLVVLFLASRGPAVPMPVGLTQGVFRVMPDARSGEMLVSPSPVGLQGAEPGPLVRGDPRRRPVRLAALAGEVRTLAEPQ
jgi:hypothetical protein